MSGKVNSLILLDVTPLSLGVAIKGDIFSRIIKRNSSIPCSNTQVSPCLTHIPSRIMHHAMLSHVLLHHQHLLSSLLHTPQLSISRTLPLAHSCFFFFCKTYVTTVDGQRQVNFDIHQGEREIASKNHLLGNVSLPVMPAPKGVAKVDVTFHIDVNGIVHVTAKDPVLNKVAHGMSS